MGIFSVDFVLLPISVLSLKLRQIRSYSIKNYFKKVLNATKEMQTAAIIVIMEYYYIIRKFSIIGLLN